jgi:hypothetical protein
MSAKLSRLKLTIFFLTISLNFINAQRNNHNASEPFKVRRDTVQVSIEGRLVHALLINDKYYALYNVRDSMSTLAIRKFYVIRKNGQIEKEIKLPKGILGDTYPKIYYLRNRIWINTEFYKGTYLLYEDKGWFEQMPEILKVPLYDDEKTGVTSECHGEFGSTIYFENKRTGTIYSDHAGCPVIVNKAGDKYFVNVSRMPYNDIVEIQDPVATNANVAPTHKILFESDDFGSDFYVPTSFLVDSTLYLIYNFSHDEFGLDEKKERIVITRDSVKIGTVHDKIFNPVYTFKDKFHIEFEQHLAMDYQICTFHTEDRIQIGFKADHPPYMEGKYGVIEIAGNEIRIHYFFSKRDR